MSEEKIISFLQSAISDIQLIYLFGSRATNEHTSNSDWDIAFVSDQKIDVLEKWEIQEGLAKVLSQQVDLIDLAVANRIVQIEAITKGTLLYSASESFFHAFENKVFRLYALLNEDRAMILKDINERGTIYG